MKLASLQEKIRYPEYTLKELLEYEDAYNDFLCHWCNLPNYERCRDALVETTGLNNDCIAHIYSLLRNERIQKKEKGKIKYWY